MIRLLLVAIALLPGSCARFHYGNANYSQVPAAEYRSGERVYRILDKPAERKMLVTPLYTGQDHGLAGPTGYAEISEVEARHAAERYLSLAGRSHMHVVRTRKLVQPQWEALYTTPDSKSP